MIEQAIADVLRGEAENDAFNQLVLFAGLEPAGRWSGCAPGSVICARPASPSALRRWSTRCAARPTATSALIGLFTAAHDPKAASGREAAVKRRCGERSTTR